MTQAEQKDLLDQCAAIRTRLVSTSQAIFSSGDYKNLTRRQISKLHRKQVHLMRVIYQLEKKIMKTPLAVSL